MSIIQHKTVIHLHETEYFIYNAGFLKNVFISK